MEAPRPDTVGWDAAGGIEPPSWVADLQLASEELERMQGHGLEEDQLALRAALERIYAGHVQAPPVLTFPVPGATLLPIQEASARNYMSGYSEFQPTAAAAAAAARQAFREIQAVHPRKDAEAQPGPHKELRELADSLRGAPASPRNPEAMAREARYPGLEPARPFEVKPPVAVPEGHLPRLNLQALASMHREHCDNCIKGEVCYFWGFAVIIDKVNIPWKEGGPPPPSPVESDRLPKTYDPDLQAAVQIRHLRKARRGAVTGRTQTPCGAAGT